MPQENRNKTITTTIEDGKEYLSRCITLEKSLSDLADVLDKTILGDSLAVLPLLPNEAFDLMIVDPPYNRTKTFGKHTFVQKKEAEYTEFTRTWLNEIYPLLKPNGSIYVCCDWQTSLILGQVMQEFFHVRNRITWQREKGRGAKRNWKNGLEDIWFATKGRTYTFCLDAVKIRRKVIAPYRVNGKPKDWLETADGKVRDTCPSNFWDDITIPFWSMPENTAHPTQKPEKLFAKILLASSKEGDVILDPFLGSGTTSVVAKKLKRHYVGIEREAQYCIWTEQRLAMADTAPAIQGYADGVFGERNALFQRNTQEHPSL